MLRSIIAIWTVALALIVIAATSGCTLGDCEQPNRGGCSPDYQPPDMALPRDLSDECPQQCGACAADEICFQGNLTAALPSFCAHACADDRDCGSGGKCAQLFASSQPTVCVRSGAPVGCGAATPNWHCDFPPASCKDASTLLEPFSDAADRVCGWEYVHCANGCANGACL